MSRPLRIEFEGALYHVMSRGNARAPIVEDDDDRRLWTETLGRIATRFGWRIWAYCLMGNHYHFLVETPKPNLSRGMRELNGVYTQAFNRRHGRIGHVFQGRFKALLVDKDANLLELCRYVVLNPVRAGLVDSASAWRWSSYAATMGKAAAIDSLDVTSLLAQFGMTTGPARRAYARFVAQGVGADDPLIQVRNQVFLGSESFVTQMASKSKRLSSEIPKQQRRVRSLAAIARETRDRNAAIREAYASGGFTLAEIGRHFGLHYATVSRIARE